MKNHSSEFLEPELESELLGKIVGWAVAFHLLLILVYVGVQWLTPIPKPKEKEQITFELVSPPGEAPPAPNPVVSQATPPSESQPETVQEEASETPVDAPDELAAPQKQKASKAVTNASTTIVPSVNNEPTLPLPALRAPVNPGGGGNLLGGYKARLQYLVNQAAREIVPDDDMDEDAFVELSFVIQRDGSKSIRISKSSGSDSFDRLALRAVQQLTFPPLPTVYEEPSLSVNLKIHPSE